MSDKPTPGTVPMTGAFVKQKHRLAAGEKLNTARCAFYA